MAVRAVVISSLYATCIAYRVPNRWAAERDTRRALLGRVAALPVAAVAAPALASGGATAGKTTSIPRAKVRYFGRITQTVIAFDTLGAAIKANEDAKAVGASFFKDSDDGPISELKTAGYLLSVAFKIDGKIPPDKIQQVKDHKQLIKDVDKLKGAMKETPAKMQAAYLTASASMNTWLEGVDLPPVGDKAWDPRSLPICEQPATGPCRRE